MLELKMYPFSLLWLEFWNEWQKQIFQKTRDKSCNMIGQNQLKTEIKYSLRIFIHDVGLSGE